MSIWNKIVAFSKRLFWEQNTPQEEPQTPPHIGDNTMQGRKRALLVGINYPGTPHELNGCVNDVQTMSDVLIKHYGFTDPKERRMLTDNSATTAAILERLEWLVDGARPGDVLYFHYSGHGCFTGDTRIPLLNGTTQTLKELAKTHVNKSFWVYSIDDNGNIVPGKAHSPRMTKISNILKITLDNGETIKCTPDHKIMLRDGTYIEAQDLTPNTSLMPLYRQTSSLKNGDRLDGYEKVYSPKYNNWVYTHQMTGYRTGIVENMFYRDGVLHHKNFNKRDNTPENLQFMSHSEHAKIHAQTPEHKEKSRQNRLHWNTVKWPLYFHSNPKLQEKFRNDSTKRMQRLLNDETHLEKLYTGVHNYWDNLSDEEYMQRIKIARECIEHTRSPEVRKRAGKQISKTIKNRTPLERQAILEKRKKAYTHEKRMTATAKRTVTMQQKSEEERKTTNAKISATRKSRMSSYKVIPHAKRVEVGSYAMHVRWHVNRSITKENCLYCFESTNKLNHKVISIEHININIPVYDITVETYHNFALDSGIFVHNSQMTNQYYDSDFEPDGLDEIICPVDLDWRTKIIRDDDLKRVFDKVPFDVNLTVVLDCCHSGSGLDQSYQYQPLTNKRQTDLKSPNKARVLPMPADITNRAYGLDLQVKPRQVQSRDVDNTGLLISGCRSDETSADAWIHNRYMGAATYYLQYVLKHYKWDIDYKTLVEVMNNKLTQYGYTQRPELNGSVELFSGKFLAPIA